MNSLETHKFLANIRYDCSEKLPEDPQTLAIMSYNGETLSWENVRLPYIKVPRCPLDVNISVEDPGLPPRKRILHKIEKYIKEREKPAEAKAFTNDATKIYTRFGVLCHIMRIKYRGPHEDDFKVYATKFKGNIYLQRIRLDDSYEARTMFRKTCLKLNTFCYAYAPNDAEPDTAIPNKNKTLVIQHLKIGNFNLIYSAGISALISEHEVKDINNLDELNKCRLANVKILRRNANKSLSWQSSPKIVGWWIEGFLKRVYRCYFGIMDDDGFIREEIKYTHTRTLPLNQKWKPNACVSFLRKYLEVITDSIATVDCPFTTYEYMYDGNKKCITYKIHEGKTEYSFLSDDLVEHLQNQ